MKKLPFKDRRFPYAFTLSKEAVSNLEKFSSESNLNMSRFVEELLLGKSSIENDKLKHHVKVEIE